MIKGHPSLAAIQKYSLLSRPIDISIFIYNFHDACCIYISSAANFLLFVVCLIS